MKTVHFSSAISLILMFTLSGCASSAISQSIVTDEISFESDGLTFTGTLYVPERDEPVPLLIVYHAASGGSSDYPFYQHLKSVLPARGIATFIYDRRGTGQQPGNFETASFEDLADDGIAAAERLAADPRIRQDAIGGWGISQGGWIAPLAATMSPRIAFAISVSGPGVSPAEQMSFTAAYHLREAGFSEEVIANAMDLRARIDSYYRDPDNRAALQAAIDEVRDEDWFSLAFLPNGGYLPDDVALSKWYYEMDFDPTANLAKLDKPFLAVFGAKDRWVPVDASVSAIQQAVGDEQLTVFVSSNSGHLMSGQAEAMEYNGEGSVEASYVDAMIDWIESLSR